MPHEKHPIRRGHDGRIQTVDVKALLDRPGGFETLRGALVEMRARMPVPPSRFDAPPWSLCPDMPRFSVGWRMAGGEDVLEAFRAWFRALSAQDRLAFCAAHPEPPDWEGYYASLA